MRHSERGNAVIFILVAIALFAALAYTFTRSAQQGQGNLTAGQTKLAAMDIIAIGSKFQKAVERMQAKGCSESQISFYAPSSTGNYGPSGAWLYNHSGNQDLVDPQCGVFMPEGGGMNPEDIILPESYYVQQTPPHVAFKFSGFSNKSAVYGVGSSASELSYAASWLRPEICVEINKQLGVGNGVIFPLFWAPAGNIDSMGSGVDYGEWDETTHDYTGVRALAGSVVDLSGTVCGYLHAALVR